MTSNYPSYAQSPVDLHLGLHTYQGAKVGLAAATLPLTLGATVPQIAGTVIGEVAGGYAGQKIAKEAGAGPVGPEISGDVGGAHWWIVWCSRNGHLRIYRESEDSD